MGDNVDSRNINNQRTSSKQKIKNVNNENVKRKSSNKKRNKKSIKSKIIVFLIFFIVIISCLIYFVLNFEVFNLSDIDIVGTEHYSKDEIIQKLNIEYGKNIFKEMYRISKTDHSSLAYIKNIRMSFENSNVLKINIEERKSEYISFNKENSKYYKLDSNGYILEECDISKKAENEVIILGISYDTEVNIGSKISEVYIRKIDSYLKIKEEYENTKLKDYGKITKVSFNNFLTTITINDKLNIILQDGKDLKYNFSLLQGIIEKIPQDSVGTVDMTTTNPVYSAY